MPNHAFSKDASFGIAGLDDVLRGGLPRDRIYLIEGEPGSGKTTVALQFLVEGQQRGERCLYITLSETRHELIAGANSHGLAMEGVEIFELLPPESVLDDAQRQTLLHAADLELGETVQTIFDVVQRYEPQRLVIDSLSEVRLLAQSSLRYRRQVLALKHFFAQLGITVLLLDDMTADVGDRSVHSVAHGVLRLEEVAQPYGAERRRLRVMKMRARAARGGFHDFKIVTGGLKVFPRLIAAEHMHDLHRQQVSSGNAQFDSLLSGGLTRGTSALLMAPAGAGKTLLAVHYILAALKRNEAASMLLFDEDASLLLARAAQLDMDLRPYLDSGLLRIHQIDAAELSPGEFAHLVRQDVETRNSSVVLIDSLNGYQAAMPDEQFLILHMHELLSFLNRRGVLTLLTVAQHGLLGDMRSPVDLTFLSDTVLLMRFFESGGRLRRALSVVKHRAGPHEDTIREYRFDHGGLRIGEPLVHFSGLLRGTPEYVGESRSQDLLIDRPRSPA